MLQKALAWLFVTDPLRAARRALREDEAVRGPALQQARLLGEIAGRVAEPTEPLPPGDRVPVVLRLLRDGVTQVLTTTKPAVSEAAPVIGEDPGTRADGTAPAAAVSQLATLWEATPATVLQEAAENAENLATVKATLLPSVAAVAAPPAPDGEAIARTRAFLDRLLWNADAARRRVESLLIQRWLRLAGLLVVLVVAGLGVRVLARGKNLLQGKPFAVSSSWSGCSADPTCDGVLLFHTNNENEPWVIFDLQKPTTLHEIEVTNRPDCCSDRTVPLVAEVSTDRQHWKEVGRRIDNFVVWTVSFPPTTARYIKLKVPRVSTLHLKAVEAR